MVSSHIHTLFNYSQSKALYEKSTHKFARGPHHQHHCRSIWWFTVSKYQIRVLHVAPMLRGYLRARAIAAVPLADSSVHARRRPAYSRSCGLVLCARRSIANNNQHVVQGRSRSQSRVKMSEVRGALKDCAMCCGYFIMDLVTNARAPSCAHAKQSVYGVV